MLTPKQLQAIPKPLTDIYSELSDFVLQDIAMRISEAAKITDTAEYLMYRARALGMSKDGITAEIARINGVAQTKIEELIREAAQKSDEFDRRMLGVGSTANTEQLQKLINAQIEQTNGLCTNLTGTLGFAQRTADGRMVYGSATDFLRKQMDMAQMKVMTGVCDYNTAIRQACYALADSGLRTVYYASGHSDRIEVAVRRALMTSVSQLTQKISEQNAAEFGADGWEISAHMGARPSHAVYQGRQYPNSQYETIVLPLITDYNCRHSAYPIILSITKPAYTDEQLAALDPPPFTYEGRRYTAYEAQQQMRKMERSMRRQKDRCVVADAVGDKDAFTAASIKLRRQKDYYEDFCKAAGTYTEYERTFVSGYNRQLAAKTGAVTRKQNAFKNAQITLTNGGDGGIIKENEKISVKRDDVSKILDVMPDDDREAFVKLLNGSSNENIKRAYTKYADKIDNVQYTGQDGKAYYQPGSNTLVYSFPPDNNIKKGQTKFETVCHEYGHFIDARGIFSEISYNEIETLNGSLGTARNFFKAVPSSSDKFLKALRSDKERLSKLVLNSEVRTDLFSTYASAGVQDALDGMFGSKVKMHWQHGDAYYNRKYSSIKKFELEKVVQKAYKELGFDVSSQAKVKELVRNYETASEMWANIMSAETCGGKALDYVKKYLPNSYETYLEIMKGLN